MKPRVVTTPDLALFAGTRVALGAGVGLLMSERLTQGKRKGAGWALLGVGVLTTIPLVFGMLARPIAPEGAAPAPA